MFPYSGPYGKKRHLQVLGLPVPDPTKSRGQIHIEANDLLRSAVEPYLPSDSWGVMAFLFWLGKREATPPTVELDELDAKLGSLAEERDL